VPHRFWLVLRFSLLASLCFAQSNAKQESTSSGSETSASSPASQPSAVSVTVSANPAKVATSLLQPELENPLHEALELYRKGDFDGAVSSYRALLQTRPNSPDAFAGIARVLLKQKKVDQASTTITDALKLNDSYHLHVALGEVLFRQGRIDAAEHEWVNVINSGHPDARSYLGLSRVRNALAMYKTGKQMIDKAHELAPDDPEITEAWAATLSRAERVKYFETMLAGPNNWGADEREGAMTYLKYLQERAKLGSRPCRLVSKVTKTETPLVRLLSDPQHLRGYGLSVSLNGHKSRLLLDTGASGITVKRSIAEHAGVGRIVETKVWGVGDKGKKNAHVGIVDSINIGELEFQNCPIEIMEARSVAEEDGLIGTDVFEDFLVDIDFPHEKLKLSELPKRPGEVDRSPSLKAQDDSDTDDSDSAAKNDAGTNNTAPTTTAANSRYHDRYIAPEMQSFTRVFRLGHDLLVTTTIGNVPAKLFLLDTGALTNCISPAAALEVTKVHGDSYTIIKGISGSVKNVYSANKAVLTFGHLRQENQDMIAFDTTSLSDAEGTEISGFLGFTLLRMLDIKIDYRDALVNFTFDSEHWGR
jgi:tetratricopeptide (TPR) repeat protein